MIFESLDFLNGCGTGGIEKMTNSNPPRYIRMPQSGNRSSLMVSAINPKHLNKLDTLACDIAVINLEDGIEKGQKPKALRLTRLFVSNLSTASCKLVVRVNPLDEGGLEEILFLKELGIYGFRIPKIKNKQQVLQALDAAGEDKKLHLSIETKEAFESIRDLAVDRRVENFYLGILDLFNDLSIPHSAFYKDSPLVLHILSVFLLDCKKARVNPISFVYQDYKDTQTFKQWCVLAKSIGYEGVSCISPVQVDIANEVFTREDEIKRCRDIVKLFEAKCKEGVSGFVDERYGFIDEPVYKNALHLLQKSKY